MASGRALLEDENAGQQQINEAVGAIHAALVNLVDQADKTALEALLEEASKLTEGKYTAASWEKLKNAKEAAQVVLENADATPQEVEEAYDALLDALVGLELIPVDKSNLKVAINLAKPIVAEADRYVATTIEGLSELLSEAEALYADEEATQEKVDEMAQRLLSASSQARLKANKTALKEAVEQAEGIDLSQYTEASAKVFSAALARRTASWRMKALRRTTRRWWTRRRAHCGRPSMGLSRRARLIRTFPSPANPLSPGSRKNPPRETARRSC